MSRFGRRLFEASEMLLIIRSAIFMISESSFVNEHPSMAKMHVATVSQVYRTHMLRASKDLFRLFSNSFRMKNENFFVTSSINGKMDFNLFCVIPTATSVRFSFHSSSFITNGLRAITGSFSLFDYNKIKDQKVNRVSHSIVCYLFLSNSPGCRTHCSENAWSL